MRRKGEENRSRTRSTYPYRAMMQMHFHRIPSEVRAEQAAAEAISDGLYLVSQPRAIDNGVMYHFRSADQAHAMQVWMEAHARVYEPWIERLESHESSRRTMKAIDDMIAGAAATGATDRLSRAWRAEGYDTAVELLREIEPGFSRMDAKRALDLMAHARF